MNREIKFRGKRLDNGKFVYGYLMPSDGATVIFDFEYAKVSISESSPKAHGDNTLDSEINIESRGRCLFIVDPKTVGQFTGTEHSSGDIYEGDLYQVANNHVYEVCYSNGGENNHEWHGACFVLRRADGVEFPFDEWAMEHGALIGNIHDNPELVPHR